MPDETKILRPKTSKTLGLLIVCASFVAGGCMLINQIAFIAWSMIGLFGVGVVVSVLRLVPNSTYLKLTSDGFEVRNLFRSDVTKWADVTTFVPGYAGRSEVVLFNYNEEHKKYQTGKKIAKLLAGGEAALPDTYGMTAKELATLMNEWKSKMTPQPNP